MPDHPALSFRTILEQYRPAEQSGSSDKSGCDNGSTTADIWGTAGLVLSSVARSRTGVTCAGAVAVGAFL
ncbi:hypothetical protein SAMN05421837_113232 [Amycolatopsis pretoriensis]|uniref:Uncharacterized protein n=1 Tax=Amycolatopsis pretoriensis TaxID=218821 RepID=A0A1H5RGA3_9PSEU|nr:hypothetical protein SAMN05421837_113232 [Amycolatopsis pretoriensis]